MWIYESKEFTSEMIGDYYGFVYEITDTENNKKYIGKKWFWSTKKKPPLKGKTRKRIVKSESDWRKYFGSSEEVKLLVEESGESRFNREILRLCKTKGECSYWELKYQMEFDVLLKPEEYYNSFVGAKIHRNHVL
jgi:hypothetical protein